MKYTQLYLVYLCSVFTLIICLTGCWPSNPDGRLAISGTVAVNGTPVSTGAISFEPIGSPAIKTPSGASIIDGKYSIPGNKGLVPGEYTVKLYGSQFTGKFDDSPEAFPVHEQLIPEKYNANSKEKVTVAVGTTKFDFDLAVEAADFKK